MSSADDATQDPLRPFLWMAALGVATTAANTAIGPLISSGLVSGSAAASLRALRDPVLLVHAFATFLPMVGLAIAAFPRSPFAAVTAAGVISFEKLIELVIYTLRLFPPEELLQGLAVRDVVAAVIDQLFFALWLCNTIGSAAAGWMLYRALSGPTGRWAAAACWSAGALTLLMLLGQDYVQLPVPAVPGWLFFFVFTSYRLAIVAGFARRLRSSV